MLARLPWVPPLKAAPKRKRLNKDRRRHLVGLTADMLRDGEPTHFAFEGACRHGLRGGFCMEGWPWMEADAAAADIVEAALRSIGAQRPTWLQGQPEYAAGREYCVQCRGPLDQEAITNGARFCCEECARITAVHRPATYIWAVDMVRGAAHRAAVKAKIAGRSCDYCGTSFNPAKPWTRFCSNRCGALHAAGERGQLVAERPCGWCQKVFKPASNVKVFCSNKCSHAHRVHKRKTEGAEIACKICRARFRPASPQTIYCSPVCAKVGRRERRRFKCEAVE